MRPFKKHITCFALLGLSIRTLYSQIGGELIEQSLDLKTPFAVTQYSSEHGLPQNQVCSMISKEDGSIILATTDGIVFFNGYEFTHFINEEEYKNNIFRRLYWDEKSNILSGTSFGGEFYLIYPYYYRLNQTCTQNELITYGEIQNDSLFLVTQKGSLFVYTPGDIRPKKLLSLPIRSAHSITSAGTYLYIGGLDGLYRINKTTLDHDKISDEAFLDLKINPHDHILYGTSIQRLYRIEDHLTVLFDIKPRNFTDATTGIEFDPSGRIFLGSTLGLYMFEGNKITHFTQSKGIPPTHIHSLFYSKKADCLFIGAGAKGLLKLLEKNNRSFVVKNGLSESSYSSVIQTRDGKILTAANCCNIYTINKDTAYLNSNVRGIFASLAEIDGTIYGGTWGSGILLISDKNKVDSIQFPRIHDNVVHATFKDHNHNIWIGTSQGIAMRKGLQFKHVLEKSVTDDIVCFYELKNGAICVGGQNGVYIIKNNEVIRYIGKKDGLTCKEVRCFYEGQNGKLWIGTYGGGLYCYYNDSLKPFNNLKGCMLDNDVFCMAKDSFGYFNISSNHGLWRIAEQDLEDFDKGKIDYLIPFHYGRENGIFNPEFNGGFQNNYVYSTSGKLYFPTIEGIVEFTPRKPVPKKLIPKIDRVYVNDQLSSSGTHVFERTTHSIQFDFSCANYRYENNVYFQHKLEGEKNIGWGTPKKTTSEHIRMLPPGKYTFMVRAIDGFNDPKPDVAVFEFEIKPYFYETLWFKILVSIFAIGIITLIIVYRIYSIRKKELAKRKLAEFELKAIQSQMSPHFIFNCLNSIKYFVISGQKENAEKFLDHFSLLIRKFLETSEMVEVLVSEESIMLYEYLSLEKMRMNNQMDFEIVVDEKCKNLSIPTMLTQPYVENAIKHGIAHLKTQGKIWLRFQLKDQHLCCDIEDNGIGRAKGMEISAQSRKHIPKGMGLVMEKSEILKTLYDKNIVIEIIDKFDANDQPCGTLVTLKIPLE